MFMDNSAFYEQRYSKAEPIDVKSVRVQKIIDFVGSGKKVLDIGCFKGDIGSVLKQRGNEVWGLELSPSCVEICNKKGLNTAVCNIETDQIPFESKFDVVLCGEIIEHVIDTEGLLKKVYAVLNNEGFLVVTTPNLASFGRRLLLLVGLNPLTEVVFNESSAGHLRYFVKSTLFNLLEKNGFKITIYTSDVVNFDNCGRFKSQLLAKLFPQLGATIIIKCQKKSLL
jgi:2-polyprenyl-3-methyl-5-hydroxy-6-metoxy-1,4-benzoquinol methylase